MLKIDEFPTHELNGIHFRKGHVFPLGSTIISDDCINFSINSKEAYSCSLCLFNLGEKEPFIEIPFPDSFKIGDNYSMMVFGLNIENLEYGYRFDGPYDEHKGLLFNKDKILLDPYAKLVSGRDIWGQSTVKDSSFSHRGRVIPDDYEWENDTPLGIPMNDLIIYEAHVRSFTMHESSNVKRGGTYAGLIEKIPHLKELGINCIELLPIFEFNELENERTYNGNQLVNYWGYSTVSFYAPKAGYAASGPLGMTVDEFKNLVKHLHKNGIEIILDVVFNHTAEGNKYGPYISYKGIDNNTYYLLTPEGDYYNFSGCGNTINCNSAIVRNHILDILRYWVSSYHIDGFRFDLASILSRDSSGAPMTSPPLLEELAHDYILSKVKLIAEAWDAGGLYQVGNFPHWGRWAEWNGLYRDCLRRFIKSDSYAGPELIKRIQGSPDMYTNRGTGAGINFITCHDGFTLNDLFSYNEKHNEANGEDNRDGANDNNSWNCGIEGETNDKEINALRNRQIKNAFAILMLSRGIPMMLSGDEFANTQFGNNNAYCQDNPISWLDWNNLDKHKDIFTFFKKCISLRNDYPVIRSEVFSTNHNSTNYPELSFHGTTPWELDYNNPFNCFGFMFAQPGKDVKSKKDIFIYCAVNSFWEEVTFNLPLLPEEYEWKKYLYSAEIKHSRPATVKNTVNLIPRSIMILIGN